LSYRPGRESSGGPGIHHLGWNRSARSGVSQP